ncbi:RHS repeat-associated core domain-containing protein [Sorangium sp. So ce887]|uniref:RHS repeat-associated core domain-containing protein n=1 Tax=Sorangium sp. So ce887 TaxID=3133324 RepID=UPI003F625865
MSADGNAVKSAAAAAKNEAPAAQRLIAPTGNAPLDVLVGDINNAAAPFQSLSDPEASDLDKANAVIGGTLSAVMTPITLMNDGFALATRDIAKLFPPLPAATLGMLHLGIPHMHTHPPAMPIPLPSFGPVALAGCASVLINGMPAARAGDLGISLLCGTLAPPFEVFTGSSKVFFGGARAARTLDLTMHCMPGAGAAKATSSLSKVVSVGGGVIGVGAQVLDAVTQAEQAKKLRAKEVKLKEIDPGASAQMTAEELEEAKAEAAAEAEAEKQAALEQAAAADASAKMTGIQAGLDAAALAASLLMGMDPGTPPCIGAVLSGHPNVLIGGFPMPPWSAVARGLGKLGKGLKRLGTRVVPKLKCMFTGHPIDPVTGANVDTFIDYEEDDGASMFRWVRYYNSADAVRTGPMGRGFRHTYEHSLAIDIDCIVYTDAEGKQVKLPPLKPGQPEAFREGYGMRVRSGSDSLVYTVTRGGEPAIEFVRRGGRDTAPRLTRLIRGKACVELTYGERGQLARAIETGLQDVQEVRFSYDSRGHLVEVRRGPRGERSLTLIAAYAYDDAECLIAWHDAVGARGSYAYDAGQRVVRMTDRNGYSFHFAYDPDGRCVEERGEDGLWRVSMRYETERRRTLVTKADGGEWIYEYNDDGTLVCVQDPYGGRLRWSLDDEGKIVEETGADGQTNLRFLYDARGRHYGTVDRLGYLMLPLDVMPNPPDPLEHQVPETALAQQWGDVLSALPAVATLTAALPASVRERALWLRGDVREPREPERRRDALGRVIEEVDAAGHRQSWVYDASGNVTRYTDRDGREQRTEITSWNLIGAEVDPLGHRTRYDYTAHERVARVVDPGGGESQYEHDYRDRLVRVVRHGVVREEYVYDHADHLIEKRDGDGAVLLRVSVGENGLPSELRLSSGEVYHYGYDAKGRITRVAMDEVEVLCGFDPWDRQTFDERNRSGVESQFEGDELRATTYFERFSVMYHRAPDGALLIETPAGGTHRIQHDGRGTVLTTFGNGTSVLSSYDHDERCRGRIVWRQRDGRTALWSVRYTYSPEGELHAIEDDIRGVTRYAYDAAHRLVGEATGAGVKDPILLDAAGNVLAKPGLPRAEFLEGNRLRAAGGERFVYDGRNHLAEHAADTGEVARYRYNSLDMLVGVSWSGRGEEWTAGYDGLGRRLYKAMGSRRSEFYWEGDRLAAEVGPEGTLRIYVYAGPEALVPLLFIDYDSIDAAPESGSICYVICNQIGSPLQIEDQAGNIVWWASHVEPYGKVTVHDGASVSYAPRFPGHYFDEELGLHYNRFRYYSPRLGRYFQSDPAGQSGGTNLYAYTANPLAVVDILGLMHQGQRPSREERAQTRRNYKLYERTDSQHNRTRGAKQANEMIASAGHDRTALDKQINRRKPPSVLSDGRKIFSGSRSFNPEFSKSWWEKKMRENGGKNLNCSMCKEEISMQGKRGDKPSIDHKKDWATQKLEIEPVVVLKDGVHWEVVLSDDARNVIQDESNLAPSHQGCNSSKSGVKGNDSIVPRPGACPTPDKCDCPTAK